VVRAACADGAGVVDDLAVAQVDDQLVAELAEGGVELGDGGAQTSCGLTVALVGGSPAEREDDLGGAEGLALVVWERAPGLGGRGAAVATKEVLEGERGEGVALFLAGGRRGRERPRRVPVGRPVQLDEAKGEAGGS
jgi:hypothetical protein